MNGMPFIIDTLINGIYHVPTLIDNGCECLAAINNTLVRKLNLPRIKIPPRKLAGATRGYGETISEMTKVELDVDGYRKALYAYVIPRLSHELILGKPWMEQEDILYHAKEHFMEIREAIIDSKPLRVWEKGIQKTNDLNIASLSAGVFLATIRRAKRVDAKPTQLFAITLADIQKALAPKKKTPTNLTKLPPQYKEFARLFKKELTDKLPPHRPGCDHQITLEPDKEVPWGPLYGMSRDELLVLRKTLTDLLDRNYIRASNSPAGAPVLFVRKPGGG
ncbi:hypothetical protein K3495_g16470, partial [Podosphaera aphanis]